MEGLKELAEFGRESAEIKLLTIGEIIVAAVPEGSKLQSVKPLLDEFLTAPQRKKGSAKLTDVQSFVELVNRFKDENSALFAKRDPAAPQLTGVLNYHEASAGSPRFGDHRAVYAFPLSKEWQAWMAGNGLKMKQAEFADFLENRILDVLVPPDISQDVESVDTIVELSRGLGGSFAGPSKLLDLSRGMAMNAEMKVKNAVNIGSGEVSVQFEETHLDGAGAPLKVPSLFLIGIPVFETGPLYRLAVRLRYRLAGGSIVWFYEIFRADKAFDDAFTEACSHAATETALPLFYGTPEA